MQFWVGPGVFHWVQDISFQGKEKIYIFIQFQWNEKHVLHSQTEQLR